jgi:hydroxyacylglutathione hydrolase
MSISITSARPGILAVVPSLPLIGLPPTRSRCVTISRCFNIDIWLEEGNLLDLGNFRLNVMHTPGHTSACISLFDHEKGLLFAADTLMPGGVMGGIFGSGSISDYIQSLQRLKGLNSRILLSGHGRLSDTPQEDVRVALQRSHALLSDTGQLFDALDARSNFEPIMQSVRDLNKLDDG